MSSHVVSQSTPSVSLPTEHMRFDVKKVPFRHIKELGRGHFAIVDEVEPSERVYRLFGDQPGQTYARKVLKVSRNQSMGEVLEEIRILKTLRHQHVVTLKFTYEEAKKVEWEKTTFGIVMDPVADCNLKEYIEILESGGGQKIGDKDEFWSLHLWLGCLARGLAYLHSMRIRHKDIKPANLLIKKGRIMYSDFGISREFADDDLDTKTYGPPGKRTEMYCAPEVAAEQPRGRKADVFSLGCVFLEMLTAACSISLQDFANWRGPEGARAYHLSPDGILRWLFFLYHISNVRGTQDYCYAALEPNPSDRVSSEDLARWIACRRDCIPNWHGDRGCSCLSQEPVGKFWMTTMFGNLPWKSAYNDGTGITWEIARNQWIVKSQWNQVDRSRPPTFMQVIAPSQAQQFSFVAADFFFG